MSHQGIGMEGYGGFSRDGGRDGYSRDGGRDREPPKERPKLALAPRSKPKEESDSGATQSNIFGGAKPVDTTQREKEIEDKISKLTVSKDEKKEEKSPVENAWRRRDDGETPKSAAYRPPGRRDEGESRRDDRGYDRGYDKDRRDDRGYDRDRRDDRGYDRDRRD